MTALLTLVGAAACGGDSTVAPDGGGSDAVGGAGGAGAMGGEAATGGMMGTGGGPVTSAGGGGAIPTTFEAVYPLQAQFPEGGIYSPEDHAFFVGSLGDGTVHRVDANSGIDEVFFTETAPGAWWTLGMAVDQERRRLWVCAMEDLSDTNADPAYDGYVWLFDLDTGTREAVYPLADAYGEATCTDVTVAADGAVYVADRDFGHVYRITDSQGPTLFAQDGALDGGIIGQNAIVVTPDQSALLVTIYLPSRMVRVDLGTAAVQDVNIDGSFADLTLLSGADGMTFHEGDVYVAFASELVKLTATLADWSQATAVEVDVPNGMTDVVSTPNGLYLLNGQAIRYAFGDDPDPFALTLFSGQFPSP